MKQANGYRPQGFLYAVGDQVRYQPVNVLTEQKEESRVGVIYEIHAGVLFPYRVSDPEVNHDPEYLYYIFESEIEGLEP